MVGLRERKKRAAMRHIQQTAIRLFQEQGFDQVTVEQVAETAEVSPSSVYRYFRTKEGLVLHDEHDDQLLEVVIRELSQGTPILTAFDRGIEAVAAQHFERDREETLARTALWATHRGIQAAAGAYLNELIERLVQAVVQGGRYEQAEAQFIVSALIHGVLAAIFAWYQDGAQEPPEQYFEQGLAALASVFDAGGLTRPPDRSPSDPA